MLTTLATPEVTDESLTGNDAVGFSLCPEMLEPEQGKRTLRSVSGASRAAAPDAILDTYTITSAIPADGRKMARLYRRLSELEFLTPDLLKRACFITLTCAKPETADTVRTAWHRVQWWLMKHGYTDYLVTSAIQGKRFKTYGDAVVHYHVIVLGHRRVPAVDVRKTWAIGATFHETAHNTTHAIRYVASYVRGNVGRLSWSTHLLAHIPGGAAPHTDCYRYTRADPANGFPGGIINYGWGAVIPSREGYSYVPALGHIVPTIATCNHTVLWRAYRMSIDWLEARERLSKGVRAENEYIDKLRRGYSVYEDTVSSRFSIREIRYTGGCDEVARQNAEHADSEVHAYVGET